MTLVVCPECREQVSNLATSCPRCGYSKKAADKKRDEEIGGTIIGLVVLGLIIWFAGSQLGWFGGTRNAASASSATPTPPPSKTAATSIDPRRLVADPNSFKGSNVVVTGQALGVDQQDGYTWIQLMAQVPNSTNLPSQDIVVYLRPKHTEVLSGDCYRVYGVMSGTSSMRMNLTGAERQVATMTGYAIEQGRRGAYGIGCV